MGWFNFLKRKIDLEVEEFLIWGKSRYPSIVSTGGPFLLEMIKRSGKRSVGELRESDLNQYLGTISSQFFRQKTQSCFKHLLKYHRVDSQVEVVQPYDIILSMAKKSSLSEEALQYFSKKGSEGGKKTSLEHGRKHFRMAGIKGAKARWGKRKLSTSKIASPLSKGKGVLV